MNVTCNSFTHPQVKLEGLGACTGGYILGRGSITCQQQIRSTKLKLSLAPPVLRPSGCSQYYLWTQALTLTAVARYCPFVFCVEPT